MEDDGGDQEILDPKIKLSATCVRVPVFVGHSEAVNIEFENPISADEARDILRKAPGCLVIDKHEPGGYATPYEAAGEDATYISRIREDATVENGLVLWCVSDNLRKGAALNAIQIAEVPDQPQADQREEEGGVSAGSRRVGKGAKRRAHHLSAVAIEVVGTLPPSLVELRRTSRFADPTAPKSRTTARLLRHAFQKRLFRRWTASGVPTCIQTPSSRRPNSRSCSLARSNILVSENSPLGRVGEDRRRHDRRARIDERHDLVLPALAQGAVRQHGVVAAAAIADAARGRRHQQQDVHPRGIEGIGQPRQIGAARRRSTACRN